MGDDDKIRQTPEQLFLQSLQNDVCYMGLSASEQLRHEDWQLEDENDNASFVSEAPPYAEPLGDLLCVKVSVACWTTPFGTWGGVTPHPDAESNVAAFLWLIEMARRARINARIETLTDETNAEAKLVRVVAYRVFVNVPEHSRLEFARICQSHLTGVPISSDADEEPATPRRGPGRPAKKKQKLTNPDAPTDQTPAFSWKRITSQAVLLSVINRMYMCSERSQVHHINWDAVAAEGNSATIDLEDRPTGSRLTTVFDLLSAQRHFAQESVRDELLDHGVHLNHCEYDTYVEDGCFLVRPQIYRHFPWAMRNINYRDRIINPCADNMHNYLLSNNDPPLRTLAERMSQGVQRFNGAGRNKRYDRLSNAEMRSLFVGKDAKHKNYAQIIDIKVPHPMGPTKLTGVTFSDQWQAAIYPVGFSKKKENSESLKRVIARVQAGQLPEAELHKAHTRVSEDTEAMLTGKVLGCVDYYRACYTDFIRLQGEVFDDPVSTALLYCYKNQKSGCEDISTFDRGLISIMDGITNYQNVTCLQMSVVLKFLCTMYGSAYNEFEPQVALAMFGKSDVGKSYVMKVVASMLSPSMQETENDTSDHAWVLAKEPFKFCWKDECNIGIESKTSKGATKSKDSKTLQAGMSNGVQVYKQYQRGKDGEQDKLLTYNIDSRKTLGITSNMLLNAAMMSRVEEIIIGETPKNHAGRTKIEYAACGVNDKMNRGLITFMQYFMTGSMFTWALYSNGMFTRPIDMSLLEVMIGLQASIFGRVHMKCRKIDRLKSQARAIMNMMAMNELLRDDTMHDVLQDPVRRDAYLKVRCAVVPIRAFEIAYSLSMPSRAFAAATTRAKIAVKKLVLHEFQNFEPITTKCGHYYCTDVPKMAVASQLYAACEAMDMETNQEVLMQAVSTLECTSENGMFALRYDGPADKLVVLKSQLDTATDGIDAVMSDSETAILSWLLHIKQTTDYGILWRYDYHEKNILFTSMVRNKLTNDDNANQNAGHAQVLHQTMHKLNINQDVRKKGYVWLTRNKYAEDSNGTSQFIVTASSSMGDAFNGLLLIEEDSPMWEHANPTTDDGPLPNRRKRQICMPGSIRVPISFLNDYMAPTERMNAHDEKLQHLSDVMHAVTGEGRVGDRLFRNVSVETDTTISSATTSLVQDTEQDSWTYQNPRRFAKTDVEDIASHFKYDDLHPENEAYITVRKGQRLYQRRVEAACMQNCGMPLWDWENHYGLKHMFASSLI